MNTDAPWPEAVTPEVDIHIPTNSGNIAVGWQGVSPNVGTREAADMAAQLLAEWDNVHAYVHINCLGLPAVRWWVWQDCGCQSIASGPNMTRVAGQRWDVSPEHWTVPVGENYDEDGGDE